MFDTVKEIDLSALLQQPDHLTSEVDVQIAEALSSDGAFVATGLPDGGNIDSKLTNLMRFFDLPLDSKMGCATRKHQSSNPNNYRGYYPLPDTPGWTHKEYFDIGPEPAMDVSNLPGATSFGESNVWPDKKELPYWQSEMLEQLHHLRTLASTLMAAIARGLDLHPEPFRIASQGRNASMRLLSQPHLVKPLPSTPQDSEDSGQHPDTGSKDSIKDGRQIVTGRHLDENFLSILWQSSVGGLQMEGREGIWKEVYPRPGTLSVHCGTLLAPLTANQLSGTPHRVLSDGTSRTSMGHFLEPEFEANIFPSSEAPPVSYAQHLINLYPDRFTATNAA